jgi:hypothetical protein
MRSLLSSNLKPTKQTVAMAAYAKPAVRKISIGLKFRELNVLATLNISWTPM